MTKQKGFTLIELLVVIAIIGILSSVVLSSLNTARGKASNSAIKSDLSNLRAQAELIYDSVTPNSYATVCGDTKILAFRTHAGNTANSGGSAATFCLGSGGSSAAYAVSSPLKVNDGSYSHWCVDSTGNSKGLTVAATTTQCP